MLDPNKKFSITAIYKYFIDNMEKEFLNLSISSAESLREKLEMFLKTTPPWLEKTVKEWKEDFYNFFFMNK